MNENTVNSIETKHDLCLFRRHQRIAHYIHKVPVILHEDLQHEAHKRYDPPTSVT